MQYTITSGKHDSVRSSAFRRAFKFGFSASLDDCKSPPEGGTTNRYTAPRRDAIWATRPNLTVRRLVRYCRCLYRRLLPARRFE